MDPELAAFLSARTPVARETIVWDDANRFDVDTYLDGTPPPDRFVTSVRAIVLRGDLVLVQRDLSGQHIEPGGRREEGEALEETLHREIQEETGWSVASAYLLGFTHFHHLEASRADSDFLHLIYRVEAGSFESTALLDDGFELGTTFLPFEIIRGLPLTTHEFIFLDAAIHNLSGNRTPTLSLTQQKRSGRLVMPFRHRFMVTQGENRFITTTLRAERRPLCLAERQMFAMSNDASIGT